MEDQLGSKQLQRALGEGPVLHLNTQRHLPPDIKIRPLFGFGVAYLVIGLQQQRVGLGVGRGSGSGLGGGSGMVSSRLRYLLLHIFWLNVKTTPMTLQILN